MTDTALQISNASLCQLGLAVINTELAAVSALKQRINNKFAEACHRLLACQGRIVVLGMGKSGHIGRKIAATMASTGSPAFFVHPAEASHGDMGMITSKDAVLALSNSGETREILTLLPLIKRLGAPLISLTGNPYSSLAQVADVNLDVSVEQEACPLGLAPTSSTTVALVMGDALAIALLDARGFTAEDFAMAHPGGSLGRRLLLRIVDIMRIGETIPKVNQTANLKQALTEMSQKRLGFTAITDDKDNLLGIFTDGDLRRALDHNFDVHATLITEVMTPNPKANTITPDILAAEALHIMETKEITALLVLDQDNTLIGVVHLRDLLRAGVL